VAGRRNPELLVVSTSGTTGWQGAGDKLAAALVAAGVAVRIARTAPARPVRTFMLTDLVEALGARRAAAHALASRPPDAVVYCSITAALAWPAPGAIWLDALAAENRPGRHGVWQRQVELRRLDQAPVVMSMADNSLDSIPADRRPAAVTVPVPIDPSGALGGPRDVDAVAYAADAFKRRLNLILEQWQRTRREGELLHVAGIAREPMPGVRFLGRLPAAEFRALLRRARVFVTAPRREDFGITALEALADGCQLVTTSAPGPYPALALARRLDPRLVGEDLAGALRTALDDPRPGYAEQAAELVCPFSRSAIEATLAERVLPRLLPAWSEP
jgi:hypothetical protein